MFIAVIDESQLPQHLDPFPAAREDHPAVRSELVVGEPPLSLRDLRRVHAEGFGQVLSHAPKSHTITNPDPPIHRLTFWTRPA